MRITLLLVLALALTLSLAGLASAAPPEVTPVPAPKSDEWKELKLPAGEIVVLSAQPASEWDTLDTAPPHTFESGKFAVFLLASGERRKVIITGPDKMKTRLVLVAAGDVIPPGPKPAPVDALKARLKAAIDADTSDAASKREWVADLAAVYREVAKAAKDDTLGTAGEFIAVAKRSAEAMLDSKAPKGVRKLAGVRDGVTAKELASVFATDGPLTDEQRKACEELFVKLAAALEGM